MSIVLWISIAAAVLSLVAVARAYVPPQSRDVSQLRARVEELEHDSRDLHERFNKRTRKETMADARAVHEQRAERRSRIEEEAARILEQQRAPQLPLDAEEQRRAYRRQYLMTPTNGKSH